MDESSNGRRRSPRPRKRRSASWHSFSGSALEPAQALEIGLINRVVAPERLLEEAIETAQRLARRPRVAVAAAKRAVYEGGSMDLPKGLHVERAAFMQTLTSAAAERGMQAYVDGLAATRELPGYDSVAREALLDGSPDQAITFPREVD